MTPSQARVLAAIRALREPSADEIAARLGLTSQGARYQLRALIDAGAVLAHGERPVRYTLGEMAGWVEAQGVTRPMGEQYTRDRIAGKRRVIARLQQEIAQLEATLPGSDT